MAFIILPSVWLIWCAYTGSVYPKVAAIAGVLTAALYLVGMALKMPALSIVSIAGLCIFLVVRTYDGDVSIR